MVDLLIFLQRRKNTAEWKLREDVVQNSCYSQATRPTNKFPFVKEVNKKTVDTTPDTTFKYSPGGRRREEKHNLEKWVTRRRARGITQFININKQKKNIIFYSDAALFDRKVYLQNRTAVRKSLIDGNFTCKNMCELLF